MTANVPVFTIPAPLLVDTSRALCAGHPDPDLWFPGDKDRDSRKLAIAICHECPIRTECAEQAIAAREQHGIFGGIGQKERERIIRKARRAA